MITPNDFITLPYPPDLTRAGLEYAYRSLAFGRVSGSPDDLRRLVACRSAELALRRWFDEQKVCYKLAQISDPLAPQILLDGKPCFLQVTIINDRREISQALHHPETLLECEARLPEEEAMPEEELILQTMALTLIARSEEETVQAIKAGHPAALVRSLPLAWAQNRGSAGLGKLLMKSEASQPVELTFGGTNQDLDYHTERLTVTPMEKVETKTSFQSLAFLSIQEPVQGRIAIRSSILNETITIQQLDWHNLWLYGMKIIFAGALNVREMRRFMTLNLRKSAVNQKIKTAELNPLESYYP